jgi:hypothetical protein
MNIIIIRTPRASCLRDSGLVMLTLVTYVPQELSASVLTREGVQMLCQSVASFFSLLNAKSRMYEIVTLHTL